MGVMGARGGCPVCRAPLWAPPSEFLGDKRCPRCSAELWAAEFSRGPVFFLRRPGESLADFLALMMGPVFGVGANEIEAALQGADSFDKVEMLGELEEMLREQGY